MTGNVAAVLVEPGRIELQERPVPAPAAHEVLVEVRAVGVCGSDVHYFREGRIGSFVVEAPLVLGHEASGVVVSVGSAVASPAVGDRVAVEPGVPCGRCAQCRKGRYNLCPDVRFLATPPVDGAFVRYLAVDADFAHVLPSGLSEDAGALIEPLSVGIWACRSAGVGTGDRVLVTGAGPIGLLAAQVARASGASEVLVADRVASRLERALQLGVHRVVDTSATPLGASGAEADVLLECTGAEPLVGEAIRRLAPGGRAVLVGMGAAEDAVLPVAAIQSRELVVTGTFRYANTYPAAIALAARGDVALDALVDARFPLAATAEALAAGSRDPSVLKAMVLPCA